MNKKFTHKSKVSRSKSSQLNMSMQNKRRREEGASTSDVARRGLVSLNQLDYVLQPDLSVATSRNMKRHYFQQTTYAPNNDAICILNSGADYIDPQHSYLHLKIKNAGAAVTHALGAGSACNFIQRVVLTTRSGDELERVEDVNKLAAVLARYTKSPDWFSTSGTMCGYSGYYDAEAAFAGITAPDAKQRTTNGYLIAPSTSADFVIPLGELFGLFRSFDRLLPSMLCSGLRFEIHFADVKDAGYNTYTTTPVDLNWSVEEISIMADSYQLTDSIQRVLNEEASIKGLELVFTSWYHNSKDLTTAANGEVNIELRKAVSRALGVLYKVSPKVGTINGIDPFISKKRDTEKDFQLRLGSLYFPQQIIKKPMELYHHSLRGWGKLKTPSAPGNVSFPDFARNLGAVYTDLERSTTQKLTGVPVNNSRIIQIRGIEDGNTTIGSGTNEIAKRSTSATVTAWKADVWLHYVRLARVFLQNVEVEE